LTIGTRDGATIEMAYDTHEPLISTEEAEAILGRLERGRPSTHWHSAIYLLSGLLQTPDGASWHGSGDGFYRVGKGKRVQRERLEAAILEQVLNDLQCEKFVAELVREARRMASPPPAHELEPLRRRVDELSARIAKLADLAAQIETPRPFLEKIKAAELKRQALMGQIAAAEGEHETARVLRAIGPADVRRILRSLAEQLEQSDRESIKDFLAGLMERVELTPDGHQCVIHYRIRTGDSLASPRGFEPRLPP
jgi:hypothetical protein